MHTDKVETYTISSILHKDSSDDAKPWPNTNEIILTAGDMLLYESAKCLHGRPTKCNGSWYTSIFTRYYPASEQWQSVDHNAEVKYGVPPHWNDMPGFDRKHAKLKIIGGSIHEPECEGKWCLLEYSVKLEGPGEYGYVLTPDRHRYSLFKDDKENKEL